MSADIYPSRKNILKVELRDGPVFIPSLKGKGVDAEYELWDNIIVSEFYPKAEDSAFYIISLSKNVTAADEVNAIENKLNEALRTLAIIWPFSGGSHLQLNTHLSVNHPRYKSNIEEVYSNFGIYNISTNSSQGFEALSTYRCPPFRVASTLARIAHENPVLRKLMQYYYQAHSNHLSWPYDLYKIRNLLDTIYEESKKDITVISSNGDWRFFGEKLNNNDLRHSPNLQQIRETNIPSLTIEDKERLSRIAFKWIIKHLKSENIPVIDVPN